MSHVTEIIILAISTILTGVYLNTAIYQKDLSESLVQTTNSSIVETNVALSATNLQKYNGVIVTGADVKNAINRYAKEGLSITVQFTQDTDNDGVADDAYVEATWKKNDGIVEYTYGQDTYTGFAAMGDSCYLNPAADFTGLVADSGLGYTDSIVFTQVGLTGTPSGTGGTGGGGSGGGGGAGGSGSGGGSLMDSDDLTVLNQTLGELIGSMEELIGALSGTSGGGTGGTGGTSGAGSSDSIATTLSTINGRLTAIESDIANLSIPAVDLTGVQDSINALQTSINALETSVNGINGYALKTDVAAVETAVKDLVTQVTAVNTTLSDELAKINNTIGTAEVDASEDDNTVMERLKKLEEGQTTIQTELGEIHDLLNVINANTGGS